MEEVAGWVAPVATMIAAMMTAANLGARFTGWGFVVFLFGSLAWSVVAVATDQQNLLWTNGFLAIVNIVGIWRWLGRRARYDDGAQAAQKESKTSSVPTLFPVGAIEGRPVLGANGDRIAEVVGAMAETAGGRIAYVVVREGGVAGVGERLHALEWSDVTVSDEGLSTGLTPDVLAKLPEVDADDWPDRTPK